MRTTLDELPVEIGPVAEMRQFSDHAKGKLG